MRPPPRIRLIRTYSEAWLLRHRATHAKHAVFGTHRHPYLRDTIRRLVAAAPGLEPSSLLDYGCGKGIFLRDMKQTGWFRFVSGYDPAVAAFAARPAQRYDLVLCLDVLDQTEDEFVAAVIEDVAQFAARYALFDVVTKQTPALAHLDLRSPESWQQLIAAHMRVVETMIRIATAEELAAGACPERAIIVAAPNPD
jgi:SAM-dependent methyltransferase